MRHARTAISALAVALSAATAHAATLSTGLAGNNGQRGIMFNIETGSDALTLTSLAADFYVATTADYEFYYVAGGIAGNQNAATNWTLHDQILDLAGTAGLQSWDIADLSLAANSVYGIYITNTFGGGINYNDQVAPSSVIAADSNLAIYSGVGKSYPFAMTFDPRGYVGSLTYEITDHMTTVPLPAPLPLLAAGIAGIWGLRRRRG
ncbi:hypothetical protein [Mangrovicoccus ximenensis]|uniref:hypothetical protein n=1 Tax=Mangrovicoccus ximenensis TaxID=1911570 RepID=UPI0011AEC318|nr:hypothetical protein [Mangrovicoccus ximenensis]